jgi:heme exporter protein D
MDWGKFFEMGGYGLYVWGSYAVTAIAMIGELVLLRSRTRTLDHNDGQ